MGTGTSAEHDADEVRKETRARHVHQLVKQASRLRPLASLRMEAHARTTRSPPENAIAFGGVAMGNMNAKLVEMVPGMSSR